MTDSSADSNSAGFPGEMAHCGYFTEAIVAIKKIVMISAFTLATVVTFIGWLGGPGHYVPYIGAVPGFHIIAGVLAMPGTLFAVFLAAIFSPQGFHGGEQFIWLSLPVNWLVYFLLFCFAFRRRSPPRE